MAELKHRVFYLKANAEIQYLMGTYSSLFTGGCFPQIVALFSNEQNDVRAVMPWGIYEGYSSVERLYSGLLKQLYCGERDVLRQKVIGSHSLNTPVISVAEDGATAKGLWFSPGAITIPDDAGNLVSFWTWQKIGCDFIYENDTWKIWHLRCYELVTSSLDMDWTAAQNKPYESAVVVRFKPDRPLDTAEEPVPPQPYRTFTDTFPY